MSAVIKGQQIVWYLTDTVVSVLCVSGDGNLSLCLCLRSGQYTGATVFSRAALDWRLQCSQSAASHCRAAGVSVLPRVRPSAAERCPTETPAAGAQARHRRRQTDRRPPKVRALSSVYETTGHSGRQTYKKMCHISDEHRPGFVVELGKYSSLLWALTGQPLLVTSEAGWLPVWSCVHVLPSDTPTSSHSSKTYI